MKPGRRGLAIAPPVVSVLVLALGAGALGAQTPTMPGTLRYGSGLIDIPVSSVLPHGVIAAGLSGFFVGLDRRVAVDAFGNPAGYTAGVDDFHSDASVGVGLYDRFETGLSLQSLGGSGSGHNMWGLFGRVRLWEPIDQGLGLAAGARYVNAPDFGDGVEYAPGRLGFPDRRLRRSYTGGTSLSLYGVATAYLRGFDGGPLPKNDLTFSLGYGSGMFHAGGKLDLYSDGHANGWFYGTSLHIEAGDRSVVTLMAEHNGFDVNVGAQIDWTGLRLGVHYLASNHAPPPGGHVSEYQSAKLGISGSVSICPRERGFRCGPRMMRRTEPDTIFIPPPPPDTVIVQSVDLPPPEGTDLEMCLSTGQGVLVRITAEGDTLVAPEFVPMGAVRPVLDFAGTYAGGAFWFENGDAIEFEGNRFGKSADSFPIDCGQILRVGVHEGVPVFADVAAERPLVIVFVPVRPGVWQRYERGLP